MIYLCAYLLIGCGFSLSTISILLNSTKLRKSFEKYESWIYCTAVALYAILAIFGWPVFESMILFSRKKNTLDNERSDEHDS